VISLLMLAGGASWSAFCWKRTAPVSASIRMARCALVVNALSAAPASSAVETKKPAINAAIASQERLLFNIRPAGIGRPPRERHHKTDAASIEPYGVRVNRTAEAANR